MHLLAATYAHGIVSNHRFIDGNKRTAFYAAFAACEDPHRSGPRSGLTGRVRAVYLQAPRAVTPDRKSIMRSWKAALFMLAIVLGGVLAGCSSSGQQRDQVGYMRA